MVSATKELERKVGRRAPARAADVELRQAERAARAREAAVRQAQIDAFFDGAERVLALEGRTRVEA